MVEQSINKYELVIYYELKNIFVFIYLF